MTERKMTDVDSILARLTALHPKRIDLSLGRIERLLAALGHPERELPPVIHVAGTNGKGSTVAFLRAILEAADLHAHVYISPHLVRFNERFRIAGKLASDEELENALAECERVNAGAPLTLFEITTAAGMLLFSRHPADVLLLEVGLGGRLDATNVVDQPAASVITPISQDHAEYLGENIDQIAVGQNARLRFTAFNRRTTPEIAARVTRVSAAATRDSVTGEHFYIAEVKITGTLDALGGGRLLPGMPVEVYVETEEQVALSYFLKPFTDQISRAFRED